MSRHSCIHPQPFLLFDDIFSGRASDWLENSETVTALHKFTSEKRERVGQLQTNTCRAMSHGNMVVVVLETSGSDGQSARVWLSWRLTSRVGKVRSLDPLHAHHERSRTARIAPPLSNTMQDDVRHINGH